jgi:hypothetical protein
VQVAVLQAAALQMTACWAFLAGLAALVAVKQVRADHAEGQLIVSPGKSTGLKAAKAVALWVAMAKAVHAVQAVTKAEIRG